MFWTNCCMNGLQPPRKIAGNAAWMKGEAFLLNVGGFPSCHVEIIVNPHGTPPKKDTGGTGLPCVFCWTWTWLGSMSKINQVRDVEPWLEDNEPKKQESPVKWRLLSKYSSNWSTKFLRVSPGHMPLRDSWQILNVIQALAAAHLVAWHFFTWLGYGCYTSFGGCWPCFSEATWNKIGVGRTKFKREMRNRMKIGEPHSILQVDKFLTWLNKNDTLLFHQLKRSRNSDMFFFSRFVFDLSLCQKTTFFLRELRHLPRLSNEGCVRSIRFTQRKYWCQKWRFERFVFLLPLRVIELY